MGICGLDHIQLAMPAGEEDRARAFFIGLLGMAETPKPANLSASGCWFESGSVNLHLGVDPDFRPARRAHPALLVDSLDDLREKLKSAEVEVREGEPIDGYERFFAFDPFGNRIEFMQKI